MTPGKSITLTNGTPNAMTATVRAPDGSRVIATLPPGAAVTIFPQFDGYSITTDNVDGEPGLHLVDQDA